MLVDVVEFLDGDHPSALYRPEGFEPKPALRSKSIESRGMPVAAREQTETDRDVIVAENGRSTSISKEQRSL
jgi:hypothetical protein